LSAITGTIGAVDPESERFIRDTYAAFVANELDVLLESFHPDAEYVNPPEAVDGGTRQGEAELTTMWRSIHELFELDSVEVHELREVPVGAFALVRFRGRGRGSGVPVDIEQFHLVTLRDGRIARMAWFTTREQALQAAGL
jgi:ketosteroid isomerase-like protein